MKIGISYFANRYTNHFLNDLKEISKYYNFIVHTFSENDLKFFKVTMKKFVELSKDYGLEIYLGPWGVGSIFGGEAFSEFVAKYPTETQITNTGRYIPKACFNSTQFRNFMHRWIDAAADLGADIIFWDEPSLYGEKNMMEWSCCCKKCKKIYRETYKIDLPSHSNQSVLEFRENVLCSFISELAGYAKERGLKNCICILPTTAPEFGITNWENIAQIPSIDIIGTDPYWIVWNQDVKEMVQSFSQKILNLSEKFKKEGQIWIQAFKIPKGREMEIAIAIETAYNTGIRNLAAWGFKGCAAVSSIACEDPGKSWSVLNSTFEKIRRKQ